MYPLDTALGEGEMKVVSRKEYKHEGPLRKSDSGYPSGGLTK